MVNDQQMPEGLSDESLRAELHTLFAKLAVRHGDFTLSSGKPSDFYVDTKQVSLHARGAALIGEAFYRKMKKLAPGCEAVGGLTLGADPLASSLSLCAHRHGQDIHAFIVRKQPKAHGTQQYLEGTENLREQMPVVILEDVITTGKSTIQAIKRSQAQGLKVLAVLALVDRQEEDGAKNVAAYAPLASLFSRSDFPSSNS